MPSLFRCIVLSLACLCLACPAASAQSSTAPDVLLHGSITAADAQTYRELSFTVPTGVTRITVAFSYTDRDKHTSIDLGILDEERFRGWSGGNKNGFTLSETDATPSYLPGALHPGAWRLLLGIPNIEKGVTSTYEARIYFSHVGDPVPVSTFSSAPLRQGPAWYRGDFHMHDAHSDGACLSQSGLKVPCPLYKTVEAAVARHLDFIAITDHNTVAHFNDERELQPFFDQLLLIPGREITTFYGHANVFGTTGFIDFRLGSPSLPDMNALIRQINQLHGLLSINHPGAPTGASCMGCGWNAPATDFANVNAIEAINGDSMDGPHSGIAFWQSKLNAGYRLTGIGGSDNHDAALPPAAKAAIGHPTTVVYADNLSDRAILDGVRAGHVFVDLEGTNSRGIEFTAAAGTATAAMGDKLVAPAGQTIHFTLTLRNLEGAVPEIVHDQPNRLQFGKSGTGFEITSDGKRHWFRVNIRSAEGRLLVLGNPIYINF